MNGSDLRFSRLGAWLPRLVLLLAASNQPAMADEPILVNLFHPEQDQVFQLLGGVEAIDVAANGDIFLLGTGDHVWRYKPDGTFDDSVYYARPLDNLQDVAVDGLRTVSISNVRRAFDEIRIERVGIGVHDPIVFPFMPEPGVFPSVDVGVDGSNQLYVGVDMNNENENAEIRKFSPTEDFLGGAEIVAPNEGRVTSLTGMDVTAAGTIYVADFNNERAGRLDLTVPFFGFVVPFTAAGRLDHPYGIAFDPRRDQVVVGQDQTGGTSLIHRFSANDGSLVSSTSIMGSISYIDVDEYGSTYVITVDSIEPPRLTGIDPTITGSELTAAAQLIVLAGKSFDESEEGAYFRGLAVRAARTQNNLRSISQAKAALSQLRSRANIDVDPQMTDPMSIAIEQINGFLTAVEANSPLIVGPGSVEPGKPPRESTTPHPLTALLAIFFAEEPFYGRYESMQPIGFPPPAHVQLTLDPTTATSNFVKAGLWGDRDLVRPEVISSAVSLDFNGVVPSVNEFSMVLGSFDINGTPSGLNRGRLAPNGQLHSQFGRQGRDFQAHVEGWITNDLYPESRPLFSFLDIEGFLPSNAPGNATVYGTNEPIIVPGLPGQPPTTMAGIGFAATRAEFNLTTGTLQFRENTDPSKTPDLSVILTPEGVFAHGVGSGEPAVGAGVSITPLVFTGLDVTSGRYEFADAVLTVLGDSGPFGSALLTDIGIDPETLIFAGELVFNLPLLRTDSPFVNTLRRGPVEILLLTPRGTLELLTRTTNFTRSGMTQTDFIVLGVVPEPGAATLFVAASSAVATTLRRRRVLSCR